MKPYSKIDAFSRGRVVGERISISKAAKLLGVSRADLNQRLLAADVPTFEGQVDYEKLKCIAPVLGLEAESFISRIRSIRENAASISDDKSLKYVMDPHREIKRLRTELLVKTNEIEELEEILCDLTDRLGELQLNGSEEQKEISFEICKWLRNRVQ